METRELFITHRIFLTRKQRYDLLNDNIILKVDGKHLSVWKKGNKTNEPCEEIECKYSISNQINNLIITKEDNEYIIHLPNLDSRMGLLDPKDGGSKSFLFAYKESIINNEEKQNIIHYIIILDYDEMIISLIK